MRWMRGVILFPCVCAGGEHSLESGGKEGGSLTGVSKGLRRSGAPSLNIPFNALHTPRTPSHLVTSARSGPHTFCLTARAGSCWTVRVEVLVTLERCRSALSLS